MIATNLIICRCNHCSGEIEFDPIQLGTTVTCPICAMDTILHMPARAQPPPILTQNTSPHPLRRFLARCNPTEIRLIGILFFCLLFGFYGMTTGLIRVIHDHGEKNAAWHRNPAYSLNGDTIPVSHIPAPPPSIHARVGSSRSQVEITNGDPFKWKYGTLYLFIDSLDDAYTHYVILNPGQTTKIQLDSFTDKGGNRFQPYLKRAKHILITVEGYKGEQYALLSD